MLLFGLNLDRPLECFIESVANKLGAAIDQVIKVDLPNLEMDQWKFVRFQVSLPMEKLLRRGVKMVLNPSTQLWVTFKSCMKRMEDETLGKRFRSQFVLWLKAGSSRHFLKHHQRNGYLKAEKHFGRMYIKFLWQNAFDIFPH
ncbi:unnamed protein product [Dovyalis caffra]|uniref:Uncharacterized protein n=1 Tax=Dovyalis caffra TaxID=77055 RepID=A0AAV1SI91_9ROSI|nr:unnamed protein product [Dovyalis caffra]